MTKVTRLTVKNLETLFGITAMTVHNWKKGSTTKPALPDPVTPAAVKRWAEKNKVAMTCDPSTLLGVGINKPGPKPKQVEPDEFTASRTRVKKNMQALRRRIQRPASASSTRPLGPRAMAALKKPRTA